MNNKLLTLLLLLVTSLPALASDPATAFDAYFQAAKTATSASQLTPHLTKSRAAEVAKLPAAEQSMMLEMVRGLSPQDYKFDKQEVTGDVAILHLSVPSDKSTTGKATMLKEGGSWKVDKVSWSSKME